MASYSYDDFVKVRNVASQEEWAQFALELLDFDKYPALIDLSRTNLVKSPGVNDRTFEMSDENKGCFLVLSNLFLLKVPVLGKITAPIDLSRTNLVKSPGVNDRTFEMSENK